MGGWGKGIEAEGLSEGADRRRIHPNECFVRADGFSTRANGVSKRANGTSKRANGTSKRANGDSKRANGSSKRANGASIRANGSPKRADRRRIGVERASEEQVPGMAWATRPCHYQSSVYFQKFPAYFQAGRRYSRPHNQQPATDNWQLPTGHLPTGHRRRCGA